MAKSESSTVHLTLDTEQFRADLEALANEIFADAEARAEAMVKKIAADILDEKVRAIVRDEMTKTLADEHRRRIDETREHIARGARTAGPRFKL